MDYTDKAKALIERILYLTVASVSENGSPWNSPVFCAYDENYNFYWGSYRDSQHSKNIRANGKVFLVIYDSTVEAGAGLGVYIEAVANELENAQDIEFAHNLLQSRGPFPWKLEQVQGGTPTRLYKAIPHRIWINGEAEVDGNCIDTRVEISLLKKN